jgi:hypothetical protein
MRHVEHPGERHRVMVQVKHLLASGTTATDAVVGTVLRAGAERIGCRRRIDWPLPPAIAQMSRREVLGDRIPRIPPAKACRRAVGCARHLDGLAVPMSLGAPPSRLGACIHAVSESEVPATLCRQGAGRE